MAGLMELNFVEYNLTQDFMVKDLICVCCLERKGFFVCLSKCRHWDILSKIVNFTMDIQSKLICNKCHQMLIKINLFRQQVEDSLSMLSSTVVHCQMKKQSLRYSDIELNSTINSQPVEFEIKRDIMTLKTHQNEMETEVKIEAQSDDDDHDMTEPLSAVKQEMTIKNELVRKEIARQEALTYSLTMPRKYDGKIKVVALTFEEMMAERENDKLKDSYLKLPFKCNNCIVAFDHENTLQDHMEKRHTEKGGNFKCSICKSVLSTDGSYKEHSKRHFRRYECEECGKRNSTQAAIVHHYGQCHGDIEVNLECECGHIASSYRGLRYHRDRQHKAKEICTDCGKSFVNKAGLKVHMYTVHKTSSRVYGCKECNKVYHSKSGLTNHMASRHSHVANAFCAECGTHFRTAAGLRHHFKVHSRHVKDEDKYVCVDCGQKFVSKAGLHLHVNRAHSGDDKFQCDTCSKVFSEKRALKKHISFVHEKQRPPRNKMCDHCGRGFTTMQILRTHIRTHTGERPLTCPHCPATFAHAAALYTHKRLLHSAVQT